jgi:hypothetical protein
MKNLIYSQKSDNDILNEYEIVKEFKTHNILKERIDIYRDFTINLLYYIFDSYLGKKYIFKDTDVIGHFNWCFTKVLDEFYEEDLDFYNNKKIYEYFYNFYADQFYFSETNKTLNYFLNFWDDIFNYKKDKKQKYFEVLVEMYDIFNSSIEAKERKLEYV